MKLYPTTIAKRIGAIVIDYIVLTTVVVVIEGVIFSIIPDPHNWFHYLLVSIPVVIFLFYLPLMETFYGGQTVGKKALGIKVVRSDGSPASGVNCLQRYLALIVDTGITIGAGALISTLVTHRRQRLGDLLADTVVVDVKPHMQVRNNFYNFNYNIATPAERDLLRRINPLFDINTGLSPMELAKMYRSLDCDLAALRTDHSSYAMVEYMERVRSSVHLSLFRHKAYSLRESLLFFLYSIPRAIYESRHSIFASLAICIICTCIGIYSQVTDHDFSRLILGNGYVDMTLENIAAGDPMGVYSTGGCAESTFQIFWNNFMVCLRLYAMGIFIVIGPLMFLVYNFVMYGSFITFFAQYGCLADAIISVNEHGTLELWSIMIAGGASLELGTGWMFPGRLSRLQALVRGARRSLLVMISTVPMLLMAATIEGYVTRHTEWPLAIKLSIIIVSALIIIGYYVVLPIIAKRK